MQNFEDAFHRGKGVIMLTGHFGNWELLGAWLTSKNYPLRVIGKPTTNPKLDKLIVKTRNQSGYINIARGTETREIIRTLKEGSPLGVLMDQDTRVKGVFVDFFGKKANTPVGPILLSKRYDAPIIPAFMYIKEDLTYHIKCFDPIELTDTGNTEEDIIINTQKCSDIYEEIIRAHPEQWVWMHKRWRRQPDEESKNLFYQGKG